VFCKILGTLFAIRGALVIDRYQVPVGPGHLLLLYIFEYVTERVGDTSPQFCSVPLPDSVYHDRVSGSVGRSRPMPCGPLLVGAGLLAPWCQVDTM